ncbi:MAG: YbaK/EbsC family protein [Firmicutes bacterium]|nr:YbaK/EbsC family protein [Bacillota bacterium]
MEQKAIDLLKNCEISYDIYHHEPVLDYEKAAEIRERFGFTGTESKSLFLKGKSGNYYVFVTKEGEKLDAKAVKNLVEEKVSICCGEEMTATIHCTPGCVAPFGYEAEISLVVDKSIFTEENLIFSPGVPETTMVIKGQDFKVLLEKVENKIYYL